MGTSLIKVQVGPVQDFIARARSTRDLWSGSYLLSWIVAKGIREVLAAESGQLIFPNPEGQPLLTDGDDTSDDLLIPNLPNLFVARVDSNVADAIARAVEEKMREEWQWIADSVWKKHEALKLDPERKDAFDSQVKRHLTITWLVTPETAGYDEAYRKNGWELDAVRQTRDFSAWSTGGWSVGVEKDSLSGREESICGGDAFGERLKKEWQHLFKHDDRLGAVSLIKRVWHKTYLSDQTQVRAAVRGQKIRSIPDIAARNFDRSEEDPEIVNDGDRYIAVIAFDGDSIGKWVNGDFLGAGETLEAHHPEFSRCLSEFALKQVRKIIEEANQGQLIYAGGDDVLAILPADCALECAGALRMAFQEAMASLARDEHRPDASVGIVMAHVRSPLQDLIRKAQLEEKRAKNSLGRSAFAVSLMKRSGEVTLWGGNWDDGSVALSKKIAELMSSGAVGARFPHQLCRLLEQYRIDGSGTGQQLDDETFDVAAAIRSEFAHVTSRQGTPEARAELETPLAGYLANTDLSTQEHLDRLTGLCRTVAFAAKNAPSSSKS